MSIILVVLVVLFIISIVMLCIGPWRDVRLFAIMTGVMILWILFGPHVRLS